MNKINKLMICQQTNDPPPFPNIKGLKKQLVNQETSEALQNVTIYFICL